MIKRLQKRYALSEQGGKGSGKGCLACVLQNLSFMFPVGLLFFLVSDLLNGGVPGEKIAFYVIGCVVCIGFILITTYIQYNATYFATYTESGVRRITLAERLRKIPLSFFGKRIWLISPARLWPTAPFLEQSFSHFIPELVGSIILHNSHFYQSVCFFDWRMALAALWVMPVAFADRGLFGKSAGKAQSKSHGCQDGLRRRDSGVHRNSTGLESQQCGSGIP